MQAARLASEASQAASGRLGAFWTEPEVLREQIRSITQVTDRPFCVNLVLDFEQDERLEVAVEERAPIVSFSFGLRPQSATDRFAALLQGLTGRAGHGSVPGFQSNHSGRPDARCVGRRTCGTPVGWPSAAEYAEHQLSVRLREGDESFTHAR